MANKKDLANGLIGTALTSAATTLVLQAGYGNSMPAVPFFLTITPAGQLSTRGNSEIVNVTARTGDTLTIERAQKETTARSFSAGDIVSNSIYADASFDSLDVDGDIYSNGGKVALANAIPTVRSQSYTTNSIVANPVIQTGWSQFLGNGTSNQSVNITFPASFTSVHSVQVSWLGYKNAVGAAASIGDFDTNIGGSSFVGASLITNNGFRADLYIAGAFGARYHGFSWTAIGTV